MAPGGVSVEVPFTLVDEGLAAQPGPGAAGDRAGVHPGARRGGRRACHRRGDREPGAPPGVRAAAHRRAGRSGRSTRRTGRPPGSSTSRCCGSAGGWSSGRPGGVIAPAPDDVVLALDPGMAFGTGLHPTTRLCLAGIERWADAGLVEAHGSSTSAAARASWPSPRPGSGAASVLGVDTDPIAVEATHRQCAAQPSVAAGRARGAARCPMRRAGPFDLVLANLIASLLVDAGRRAGRRGRPVTAPAAADACWRRASSSTGSPRSAGRSQRPAARRRARPRKATGSALDVERPRPRGAPRPSPRADGARQLASCRPHRPHQRWPSALFLPSFLLPFTMRTRTRDGEPVPERTARRRFVGASAVAGGGTARWSSGRGVAVTGLMLLVHRWVRAFVLAAVAAGRRSLLYAVVLLVLAFFVQRPSLRRLLRHCRRTPSPDEKERWRARARRQRYVSYLAWPGRSGSSAG